LSEELARRGQAQVAKDVGFARYFAVGSPSEFLHESEKVLTAVLNGSGDVLTDDEKRDMRRVVSEIEEAFRRVGGA
jgi:hypothetical protein